MSEYKHPACLWWLSAVFSLFMFSFGGLIAALVLYLHEGLHFPLEHAYAIFGAFASMMWTLPFIGGYLAGKLGHKRSAGVGAVTLCAGLFLLVLQNFDVNVVGLALFVVGNGLFSPALWCLVDHVYSKQDHRREGGCTYFYLLFNVGAVIGIFLGGAVASQLGFHKEFLLDAVVMLLGTVIYLWKIKNLQFHSERRFYHNVPFVKSMVYLVLTMIVGTPLAVLLFRYTVVNNILLYLLSLMVLCVFVRLVFSYREKITRRKLYAFMLLMVLSIVFWSLYNLEPSLLSVFIEHNVSRTVGQFTIPASSFFGFEGVFVVVVGLVLSRVWVYLSMRRKDLALPTKFSLSLFLIGFGFLWLCAGSYLFGLDQPMPLLWMVFAYAFLSTGELLVGPIGLSMVGRLSPPGKEGLLMGSWQLTQGLAAVFGELLARSAVVPENMSLVQSNHVYDHLFLTVGCSVVVLGVLAVCCVPSIKKLLV